VEDYRGDGKITNGGGAMQIHRLKLGEAIEGSIDRIEVRENSMIVIIAGVQLRYSRHGPEGRTLMRRLKENDLGRQVIIARLPQQIRVVWVDNNHSDDKLDPFWNWCCERFGIPEGVQ